MQACNRPRRAGGRSTVATGYPSPAMPTDLIDLAPPVEKAFLVAVDTGDDDGWTAEDSLAELANLATTAGAEVVGAEWQNRRHVDPNWYVGKGKAEELVAAKRETGFDLLVADDELSPAQQKRARGAAQRQGHRPQPADPRHLRAARPDPRGPAPGRARPARVPAAAPDPAVDPPVADPGRHRLARTRREPARDRPADHPDPDLEDEGAGRAGPPAARDGGPRPRPAAVADGRHRRLHERRQVDAAQLARRLARSRRPRTSCSRRSTRPSRQVKLGDGQTAIVTDTVGFIHKLPHQLVDAFRATLEEVNRADVLVEVVDASDAHFDEHRATVQTVLDELGAGDKPRLVAFNKADLLDAAARDGGDAGAGHRGRGLRVGADRLRARHAAGRDRGAAGLALGRRRRPPAVRGGRAAGARPRARHDRARVRRARRPRRRPGRAAAGRRAAGGGGVAGRRRPLEDARGDRGARGGDRRPIDDAHRPGVAGWGTARRRLAS